MRKIVVILLMATLVIGAYGQQSPAKLFANLLKDNQKQIEAAYQSGQTYVLPDSDSIKAYYSVARGSYLFLSTRNKGLEIMFCFRSSHYTGYIPGLLYVYITGLDSTQATWVFYANNNLTGMFLSDEKSEAADGAGEITIPVFSSVFYEIFGAKREKFIAIVTQVVNAFKK